MLRASSSTGSSDNLTPTAVAVEGDEVDCGSGGGGSNGKSSKISQRFIQGFKNSTPTAVAVEDDEVDFGIGSKAIVNSSKSSQRFVQASVR